MYSNKTIIQIGSHVGASENDPIFNLVDDSTQLILVEPIPFLFRQLKENYTKKFPNNQHIVFINKAASNHIGEIQLTAPSEDNDYANLPFYASQLASINSDHAVRHIPELKVETITVPTTTIDQIVEDNNIKHIDLLHTDTEGHDYDIIMNYSFQVKPRQILFEHKHMDGFFEFGTKFETLKSHLEAKGYIQKYQNGEDTMMELVVTEKEIKKQQEQIVTIDQRLENIENMLHEILKRLPTV